jgi:hypothetical protein
VIVEVDVIVILGPAPLEAARKATKAIARTTQAMHSSSQRKRCIPHDESPRHLLALRGALDSTGSP